MKVNSKVTIYTKKIKKLTRAQITSLEKTAEALHTEVIQAQVMPRDSGNLQNESSFVDYSGSSAGKVSLISSTPYARRLYYHPEYKFKSGENPNAKAHWYEDWVSGNQKDFCKNTYRKFYKAEGGI